MTEDKPKKKTPRPPDPARKKRAKHANRIARKLKEKHFGFGREISKLIFICGHDFADEMLKRTFEIEEEGGLWVKSGKRRRTPGGVFMKLAKDNMTDEQRRRFLRSRRRKASGAEVTPDEPQAESSDATVSADAKPNKAPASVPESKPPDTTVTAVPDEDTASPDAPDEDTVSPEPLPPLDTMPAKARSQLRPLYAAHGQLQKRVADLEASGKTGGLKAARLMTQVSRQKIDAVLAQYSENRS